MQSGGRVATLKRVLQFVFNHKKHYFMGVGRENTKQS